MSFTASAGAALSAGAPAPPAPPARPSAGAGISAAAAAGKPAGKSGPQIPDPATTLMFHLGVDAFDVGWWNGFDGLGMETAIEQREEGGNNLWVYQLPTRLKFTNVKLSRPINEDSQKVAEWFMSIVKPFKRTSTAMIQAVDGNKNIVAKWSLQGVVPVRWTGPSFSVDSPKMATETLELAHHGFYEAAKNGGKA